MVHTFIPEKLLREIAKRNPGDATHQRNLAISRKIRRRRKARVTARINAGPSLDTGTSQVQIYDAQRKETQPGTKARFDGEAPVADAVVNNSFSYNAAVRDFYRKIFGRNSIDNQGMNLVSTVHYGDGYNNAFWDGKQMVFGDGDGTLFTTFVALDVTGHEMTHGVTEFDSGEEYSGMSGSLNESNSDVGGEMIEQYLLGQTSQQADWLVGKGIWAPGINGKALRSMLEPGTAFDDPKLGKDDQPGHMKDYVKTWGDNGGVHTNSGIPNKAFATFARALGGYSWEVAGKIWYEARKLAGSKPSFYQFAYWTIEVCKKVKVKGATEKLRDAWKLVGVTPDKDKADDLTPIRAGGKSKAAPRRRK